MVGLYLAGAVAFGLFVLYDLNQIGDNRKIIRFFFPLGIVILLVLSIVIAAYSRPVTDLSLGLRLVFGALAAASMAMLCYTLFFAVPFDAAYVKGSKQKLETCGVYGMCRHPGVLFLAGTYLFVALALNKQDLLIAGAVFSVYNVVYVVIQDLLIFPKIFEGYEEYRRSTHFLLPFGRKHHEQEDYK